MPFVVETGSGLTNATAYCTVEFARELNAVEGNDLTAQSNKAIEYALQRATRYMDAFHKWLGYRRTTVQALDWPRVNAVYNDGRLALDVPPEVQEACALYAFYSLSAALAPNPTYDDSGARVLSKTEKVGPIEESVTYAADGALATKRSYPLADARLRELLITGQQLVRA